MGEADTGVCFDCGGTAIRLDTATGALDCVDCGNETETETETETRSISLERGRSSECGTLLIYADGPLGQGDNCSGIEVYGIDRGAVASLVVAAPTMLAALQRLSRWGANPLTATMENLACIIHDANVAISKAEEG